MKCQVLFKLWSFHFGLPGQKPISRPVTALQEGTQSWHLDPVKVFLPVTLLLRVNDLTFKWSQTLNADGMSPIQEYNQGKASLPECTCLSQDVA